MIHILSFGISQIHLSLAHARNELKQIFRGHVTGFIPVIVLAELALACEKHRVPLDFERAVEFVQKRHNIELVPIDLEIVRRMRELPALPDLHDRLIVAAAIHLNATLITADRAVTASSFVPVLW